MLCIWKHTQRRSTHLQYSNKSPPSSPPSPKYLQLRHGFVKLANHLMLARASSMVLLMTPAPIYRHNHPIDKMFSISAPYLLSSPWKPLSTSPIVGTHRVHVPLGCKSFGLFCLHARRTKHEITKHEVCIKKNPKQNKKTGEEGLPAKGVTLFTPHVQAGFSLLHRHALLFGHAHSQATPRMGTPFDGPVL